MLNIHNTAAQAASEFGLSMKDDPTLWPDDVLITATAVQAACQAAATENAQTALARSLGRIAETVATAMDVAIAEDGTLADLDAVLAQYVEDGSGIDLSGVAAAADWDARVEATRTAFRAVAFNYTAPPLPIGALLAYAASEPRFTGDLRRSIAALHDPEFDEPEVEDDPDVADPWADDEDSPPVARERGKPAPGRKRRTRAEIAEDEAAGRSDAINSAVKAMRDAGGDEWDESRTEHLAGLEWDDEDAPALATAPNLPGLASAAGIADMDMAAMLGFAKGYYSLIRNGKRPWPGVKPDQVHKLRSEIAARREALDAIDTALSTDAVLKPEGV